MRFAVISVLLVCAMAMQTRAATITVTNTNDSGPGSLRQALVNANDGDTINFAVTGSITLTSGGLGVDKNVTISGPGADRLSIDGNHAAHQFVLVTGADNTTISGLTIINGDGGILNGGATLTVGNCVVRENSNAGLYNTSFFNTALLTIANSIVRDNSGPGISTYTSHGQSNTVILNCTISGNSTKGEGGGISSFGFEGNVSTSVENSDISGNSARSGGGIACDQFSGLSIVNSTISGNSAGSGGGVSGLDLTTGISIMNSTISGNSAGTVGGGVAIAGSGIVANSTISDNSAASGGGIYNGGPFATLQISNTILNAGASGANIVNDGGTITSDGYNLSSDDGGGYLTGPGDQINTDPLLAPLQDNGGPTFTHALLPGSPAINEGDPNFTPPPSYDQRGPNFYRVRDLNIDIGSFEVQAGIGPRQRPTPRPRPTPPG
jgi:hypothetical protein